MKTIIKFIRVTLSGGILLIMPVLVVLIVVKKALNILLRITTPWDKWLDKEIIWGLDGHNLAAIGMLLFLCFLAGLIFRIGLVKSSVSRLESGFLSYIPGYLILKSLAIDAFGDTKDGILVPILIKSEESVRPAFLVEQQGETCIVFIPDAPNVNSGEVHIIDAESVTRLSISTNAMRRMLANFGKGLPAKDFTIFLEKVKPEQG